jgi:hypothetical protein
LKYIIKIFMALNQEMSYFCILFINMIANLITQ